MFPLRVSLSGWKCAIRGVRDSAPRVVPGGGEGLLGSRESFVRTFQRPIEQTRDTATLERLRAIVQPFILRRAKDSPEVELERPGPLMPT